MTFAYATVWLFILVYCARPGDWIPGLASMPLAEMSAILALLGLALSFHEIRRRLTRDVLYLALLVGQLFLAAVLSPVWRGGALQQALDFAKILLVVVMITVTVTTSNRLRSLFVIQVVSVSAIAVVSAWKGQQILGRLEGVLNGIYHDPNDMALAIAISLPLCLALLLLSRNGLWTILCSISMLVMIYTLFLTGSRGGFLAFLTVAAVCLREFAIRGRRRYLLGLAALVGVIFWQFAGGMLMGRIKGTLDVEEDTAKAYDSGQARQQLFWQSIEVTMAHPFFGVGVGNFDQASGAWHTTHNAFTLMSAEGGLPALTLYLLILWRGFKNTGATKRLAPGVTELSILAGALRASVLGYVVGSSFLSVSYQFFPYILVAYTTALFLVAKNSEPRPGGRQIAPARSAHIVATKAEISWHAS